MLRNDNGPQTDPFRLIGAEDAITPFAIIPLSRLEEADTSPIGVAIGNDADTLDLAGRLDDVALVVIDFPSFADGRGFSLARRLRDLGYRGRLRARGPVIADQYAYLRACGFDEVETDAEIDARQPEAQWTAATAAMTLGYSKGYPGPRNIWEARRAARS